MSASSGPAAIKPPPAVPPPPDMQTYLDTVKDVYARKLYTDYTGVMFRCATPCFNLRAADCEAGEGSRYIDGRWHSTGEFLSLYTASSPELALEEGLASVRRDGGNDGDELPKVILAYNIRVKRVLNLTDGHVQRALGVSANQLTADDWWNARTLRRLSLCQCIAKAAYEVHIQGLLAPSRLRPSETNLIVFPERLTTTDHVRVQRSLEDALKP